MKTRTSRKLMKAASVLMLLLLLVSLVPIAAAAGSEVLPGSGEVVVEPEGEGGGEDTQESAPDPETPPEGVQDAPPEMEEPPPAVYTIRFFVNGSELPAVAVATVDNSYTLTQEMVPAIPAELYDAGTQTFDGWFAGSPEGGRFTLPGTVSGDLSLHAKVTDKPDAEPEPAPDAGPDSAPAPAPPSNGPGDTPAEPETIELTLTVGGTPFETVTVPAGAAISPATLPQPPMPDGSPEGTVFLGWYLGDEPFDFSTVITGALSLDARFGMPEADMDEPEEPEPVTITVTLYLDGKAYGDPIVVDESGHIPAQPAPPQEVWPQGAVAFRGWFTSPDGANLFDFGAAITGSMDLYAVFGEAFVVEYMDAAVGGKVIDTKLVAPGGVIPATDKQDQVSLPLGGAVLTGWYPEGGSPDAPIVFGASTATADMRLLPIFSNEFYVVFHSEGTQVEPQMVRNTEWAKKPSPDPTREGYTLKHWSLAPNGEAFDFNTRITGNTDLYAVWEAEEVPYTVVYWLEKPGITGDAGTDTANYGYLKTDTAVRTALAGSTVDDLSGSNLDKVPYAYYSHTVSPEILGNGLSIVNVYFKRTVYTLNFDLGPEKGHNGLWEYQLTPRLTFTNDASMTNLPGQKFSPANPYSFTAKYEADIEKAWPSSWNATIEREGWVSESAFSAWNPGECITKRFTLMEEMIPSDLMNKGSASESITYSAKWEVATRTRYVEYWVECLPDEMSSKSQTVDGKTVWFVKDVSLSQSVTLTKDIWGAFDIFDWFSRPDLTPEKLSSMTNVAKEGDGSKNNPFRLFYTRARHTLTFEAQGGMSIPKVDAIMYEAPLLDHAPEDPTRQGYTFDGWFYDAECRTAVDFGVATMPDNDLVLFAGWESTECVVTFTDIYGGAEIARQGVKRGGYVDQDKMGSIELDGVVLARGAAVPGRGVFEGWYMMVGGQSVTAFNAGIAIHKDLTVFAKWRTTGFTVTYNEGEGSGAPPTDSNTYDIGAMLRVKPAAGLNPPSGKVFLGWKSSLDDATYFPGQTLTLGGDITLTAVFGSGQHTLTFTPGYEGSGQENVSWRVNGGQSVRLPDKGLFTRSGHTLVGWRVGNMDYTPGAAYTCPAANTTVEAVWSEPGCTVRFVAGEGGSLVGRSEYANIPGGTLWGSRVAAPRPVADSGWYFAGWEPALPAADAAITGNNTYTAKFAPVREITITAGSKSWPYDGQAHSYALAATDVDLPAGDRLVVTTTPASTVTRVADGSVPNAVRTWKIMRTVAGGGEVNVTSEYTVKAFAQGTLSITPKKVTVQAVDKEKQVGQADPQLVAVGSGFVTPADIPAYKITRAAGEASGTYPIRFTETGENPNYTIEWKPGTLTIKKTDSAPIFVVTANSNLTTYNGKEQTAAGYTVNKGDPLPAGYEVFATTNDPAATNVVETGAHGLANRVLKVAVTFNGQDVTKDVTVVKEDGKLLIKPIQATMQANGVNKLYGEDDPALTATPNGFLEGDAPDAASYTLVREPGSAVGTYQITFSTTAKVPNYSIRWLPGVFEIATGKIDAAAITLADATKVYGEADPAVYEILGLPAGFVPGVDYEAAFSRETGEDVAEGGYTVTLKSLAILNSSYELEGTLAEDITATLTITKRPAAIEAAAGQEKLLGTQDPALTATAEMGNPGDGRGFLTAEALPTYTLTRAAGEHAGTYGISFNNKAVPDMTARNYAISWNTATFEIKRDESIAIEITADGSSQTYSGGSRSIVKSAFSTSDLPNGFTVTAETTGARGVNVIPTTADGDTAAERTNSVADYTVSYNGQPLNAGDVAVTLNTGTLTIQPKDATVTVDAGQGKRAGTADPDLTATPEGFVDTGDVPYYELVRDPGEASGAYGISFHKQAANTNYNITWREGTFTIEANPDMVIEVTGESLEATYDRTEQTVAGFVTGSLPAGFQVNATASGATGVAVADAPAPDGIPNEVSDVVVLYNGVDITADVTVNITHGKLVIKPIEATMQANGANKVYGADDPALTATPTGFLDGDAPDAASYTLEREAGDDVGTYAITFSATVEVPNYSIQWLPGSFDITTGKINASDLQVASTAKVYGEADPESYAISGLPAGFTEGVDYEADFRRATGEDVQSGGYDVTVATLTIKNTNYELVGSADAIDTGSLSITKRPTAITVEDGQGKKAGEADPATFTASIKRGEPGTGAGFLAADALPTFTVIRKEGEKSGGYVLTFAAITTPDATAKNYDIDWVDGTFTIAPNPALTITITADSGSLTYNGGKQALPTTGYTLDAPVGFTAANVRTTGATATNVVATAAMGDQAQDRVNRMVGYDIQFNGQLLSAGDVTVVEKEGALTITPARASVSVNSVYKRLVGEADPTFEATPEGFFNPAHVPAYRLIREEGEASGKYLVSFASKGGNPNYDISWNVGSMTIVPNNDPDNGLRIDVVGNSLRTAYTGTPQTASGYTATLNGGALPEGYTVEAITSDPSATTVAEAAGGLTNKVAADVQVSINGHPLNQGDVVVAIAPGTLVITPAQVQITGENRSIKYGEAIPAAADLFTVAGKPAAGEDVVFTASYDDTGKPVRDVGGYPATATFEPALNPNYQIQSSPGKLNIVPSTAEVVVTINNASKVYGTDDHAFSATVTGLAPGDTLDYTLSREAGVNVGGYKITASVTPNANYAEIAVVDGTLTINKRPMVLVANSYTITQGGAIPAFTAYMAEGYSLAPGDSTLLYSVYRENTGTAIGSYPILIGLGENPNYDISTLPGTLTIQAAPAPAPAPAPGTDTAPAPAPAPVPDAAPAIVPAGPAAPAPLDGVETLPEAATPMANTPDTEPTEPQTEIVQDEPVPLGEFPAQQQSWALTNLIAAILSLFLAVVGVVSLAISNRSGRRQQKQTIFFRLVAILAGAAAPLAFFALGGWTGTMAITDQWTLLMAGFLAVQCVMLGLARRAQGKTEVDTDESY